MRPRGRNRISPRDLRGEERFTMSASRKRFAFIATATAAVLVGSGIAVLVLVPSAPTLPSR